MATCLPNTPLTIISKRRSPTRLRCVIWEFSCFLFAVCASVLSLWTLHSSPLFLFGYSKIRCACGVCFLRFVTIFASRHVLDSTTGDRQPSIASSLPIPSTDKAIPRCARQWPPSTVALGRPPDVAIGALQQKSARCPPIAASAAADTAAPTEQLRTPTAAFTSTSTEQSHRSRRHRSRQSR